MSKDWLLLVLFKCLSFENINKINYFGNLYTSNYHCKVSWVYFVANYLVPELCSVKKIKTSCMILNYWIFVWLTWCLISSCNDCLPFEYIQGWKEEHILSLFGWKILVKLRTDYEGVCSRSTYREGWYHNACVYCRSKDKKLKNNLNAKRQIQFFGARLLGRDFGDLDKKVALLFQK